MNNTFYTHFTREHAERALPDLREILQGDRKHVNLLKRQIEDIQDKFLKRRKQTYTENDLEYFQIILNESLLPSLKNLEQAVYEVQLMANGYTWEQVVAQREKTPEDEPELTLF
ncbi:hypothetical protein [Paenibacillus hunanensis]|uniref:Uncharacterized protein n=1 Tax=Paenibacillus hunanensis TaxID=539262 RepID=A0ABU1IV75_9BACL|nr:hypothetical protein [Paenibacillus hunanensis]MDR6243174.1 hypothetical protein [Paenibacillus hunanensis]GGJ11286.1 hypothetical protein GCM10008022_20510 [Paenibacillus hunanensis]